MASDATPAHQQSLTLHLITNIPEHEPRESDPHYGAFLQAKARLKRQGLWKCVIGDDLCGGQVELHHSHIEFSQINATDLDKVNAALGLDLADDAAFQAWVEGPGNLEPLCLPGNAPVLMGDGTHRPIMDVRVGDRVIGHDMRAHVVTATTATTFTGKLVDIDGCQMTGNHPVLTARGWMPAIAVRSGDVVCRALGPAAATGDSRKLRMLDQHMLSLSGIQSQVLESVVISDAVDVVHTLSPGQLATKSVLHNKTVLHDKSLLTGRPVNYTNISGRLRVPLGAAPNALQAVEAQHAAGVRTVAVQARVDFENFDTHRDAAFGAVHRNVAQTAGLATFTAAFPAARHIPMGKMLGNTVVVAADCADLDDQGLATAYTRRWDPVSHIQHVPYTGQVYDIEVLGSSSFVTGDIVVHNCATHHRTHFGIHVLPQPLWEPLRYRKVGSLPSAEFIPASQLPGKGALAPKSHSE